MRRPFSVGLLTLAVAVVPFAADAGAASPTAPRSATGPAVLLAGTKPAIATPATRLSTVPGTTKVQIGVTLRNSNIARAQDAINAIYTPGSATFHQFFTPADYAARYSVDAGTQQATVAWATSTGLTSAFTDATGDYYLLTGTAAQADSLFRVSLGDYSGPTGSFRASEVDPSVPAGLPISGVLGLDTLHVSHLDLPSKATAAAAKAKAVALGRSNVSRVPSQDGCNVPGVCTGLTRPEDLWSAYDQPDNNRGAGQKIAIFGEGAVDATILSLRDFEKFNRLRHVNIGLKSVADDFVDTAGTDEWQLDTQSSTGMAPDAAEEDLYFSKDLSDPGTVAVVAAWAKDPAGPLQASASYGECEAIPGATTATKIDPATSDQETVADETAYAQQTLMAAGEGRTLFSSTGDTGYGCAETTLPLNGVGEEAVPLAPYPAADPYVVAVGGTILSTDHDTSTDTDPSSLDTTKGDGAKRSTVGEVGWEYGGGGPSSFIAMPSNNYQASAFPAASTVGVVEPVCKGTLDGSTTNLGKPCKDTPDISDQSGDVGTMNGYALSAGGSDNSQGAGTSLSSPLAVGMWTRIQAAAPANSQGVFAGNGFANYQYYKNPADFTDITTGTNGGGHAGPGYDEVTGLGVMDVSKLMMSIDKTTAPANAFFPADTIDPLQKVCLPGGTTVDPAGDATSVLGLANLPSDPTGGGATNDPGLDLTKVFITQDTAAANLTFHIDVANLAGATPPGQFFRFQFGYAGTAYYAELERDATGALTFELINSGAVGGSTTVLTGLSGKFDDAANEASVVVPVADFNTKGMLKPALAVGGTLTDLDVLAQRPTGAATITADEANSGGCGYTLTGASVGTPAVASTTASTAVAAVAAKKAAAKKKAAAAKKAVVKRLKAPTGTLAYTGLDGAVPFAALALLGGGMLALRRRRRS